MGNKRLRDAGSGQLSVTNQFRGKRKSENPRSAAKPTDQDVEKSDEQWEDMRTFAIFLALAPIGLALWLGIIWFVFWLS